MAPANEITPCRKPWGGTMTPRERFNAQMHFQPVDRCFNMEFGYWDENFKTWPMFVENGVANNRQADRFFNFDRIKEVHPNVWLNPRFERKILGETATTKIIQNDDGLVGEAPKDGHDTIPHYTRNSVVTPDDWKRVKDERMRLDDPERILDVEAILAQHPNDRPTSHRKTTSTTST
jgi:uroporphyrinogen decarboxylase